MKIKDIEEYFLCKDFLYKLTKKDMNISLKFSINQVMQYLKDELNKEYKGRIK